eukprot:CFRG8419T1
MLKSDGEARYLLHSVLQPQHTYPRDEIRMSTCTRTSVRMNDRIGVARFERQIPLCLNTCTNFQTHRSLRSSGFSLSRGALHRLESQ